VVLEKALTTPKLDEVHLEENHVSSETSSRPASRASSGTRARGIGRGRRGSRNDIEIKWQKSVNYDGLRMRVGVRGTGEQGQGTEGRGRRVEEGGGENGIIVEPAAVCGIRLASGSLGV